MLGPVTILSAPAAQRGGDASTTDAPPQRGAARSDPVGRSFHSYLSPHTEAAGQDVGGGGAKKLASEEMSEAEGKVRDARGHGDAAEDEAQLAAGSDEFDAPMTEAPVTDMDGAETHDMADADSAFAAPAAMHLSGGPLPEQSEDATPAEEGLTEDGAIQGGSGANIVSTLAPSAASAPRLEGMAIASSGTGPLPPAPQQGVAAPANAGLHKDVAATTPPQDLATPKDAAGDRAAVASATSALAATSVSPTAAEKTGSVTLPAAIENTAGADRATISSGIGATAAPPALAPQPAQPAISTQAALGPKGAAETAMLSAIGQAMAGQAGQNGDERPDAIMVAETRLGAVNADFRGVTVQPEAASQTARSIAAQIADAMAKGAERAIEVSLNPAELGRVRITLAQGEAGMIVNVAAERAETLDLMRRNSELLGREFQDLGYEGTDFSFSQDGRTRDDKGHAPSPDALGLAAIDAARADDTAHGTGAILTDRLDIRL